MHAAELVQRLREGTAIANVDHSNQIVHSVLRTVRRPLRPEYCVYIRGLGGTQDPAGRRTCAALGARREVLSAPLAALAVEAEAEAEAEVAKCRELADDRIEAERYSTPLAISIKNDLIVATSGAPLQSTPSTP
ncbi:hypothetical protein [Burkholderia ubonensis]|uniref:hypothetical protein n=1 Tax=Burkholderia ubonensis TaxID=101571 RepID=UPI0012BAEC24|nr:hypothetical protein [Burkholderia ubonensis]